MLKTKFIFIFLALAIAAEIVFFAYVNFPTSVIFKILPSDSGISLPFSLLFIFAFGEGIFAGLILLYGAFLENQIKLKEYKRALEKTSVNADCDSSKVAVLESKIEVLEKALKTALEQNN